MAERKTRQSLSYRIAEQLRTRIVEGEFPLGSCLPSERELSRQMGVGRQAVNTAFERLEVMGLVVRNARRGAMVTAVARAGNKKGIARVLIARKSIAPNWAEHPRILRGVTDTLEGFGYEWQRHDVQEILSDLDRVPREFDGIIFIEAYKPADRELAVQLAQTPMPVVVANLEGDDLPVSYTCVDHHAIARSAVQMLLDYGHRRIAFVGYDPGFYFYGKMLAAYRETLQRADIDFEPSLVEAMADLESLVGYRAMLRMLRLPDPPTGVFAARDGFAQGACAAIRDAGLVLARDISVIGYDDLSWPCPEPVLTTFREPAYDMGAEAARLLVERIIEPDRPRETRTLDAPLVLRRSAGPHIHPDEDERLQPDRVLFAATAAESRSMSEK